MSLHGKPLEEVLLVFARAPVLGTVKTRLAATVGPEAALAAYCEMLSIVATNLKPLEAMTLCVTPDESSEEFERWRQPEWQIWPQGGGDLGGRLERAFARAFDENAKRVIIVGVDCPDVRAEHIREGWRRLDKTDLVLGPAGDGGYWLIGLNRLIPQLFRGMPWSSAGLLQRTMETARELQISVSLMETLGDIDTEEDWLAYKRTRSAGMIDKPSL